MSTPMASWPRPGIASCGSSARHLETVEAVGDRRLVLLIEARRIAKRDDWTKWGISYSKRGPSESVECFGGDHQTCCDQRKSL